MTIPAQTIFATATANGVTTVFAYGFKIIDNDDLAVYSNGAKITIGFVVAGAGSETGGTVTFSSPPVNGTKLIFTSEPVLSRDTDYQQFGDFNASTLNPDFDRLWAALQYAEQVNNRAIKLSIDTAADQVIIDDAATRANRLLGFDGAGAVVTLAPVSVGLITPLITPYFETLLDDASAIIARSTLGLADATAALTLLGLAVKSPAGPTVRLENTDTTINTGDNYGAVEFFGNDASTDAGGVRAKIECLSTGIDGGSKVSIHTANGVSTALVESVKITPTAVDILPTLNVGGGCGVSGETTCIGPLRAVNTVSLGYGHMRMSGYEVMYSTDTQIDVDLLPYLPIGIDVQTVGMFKVQVVGKYLNSFPSGTVYASSARLFKSWSQAVAWDGTTYVILGATLDFPAYNSDATNFPAGAVNASKALLVVSASGIWLRLQNRTGAAVGSVTGFQWTVDISVS